MEDLPTEVPRAAGNLNDGLEYERKLLMFIAASLSQNKEVTDFAIVSNPKGIDKIDDVVVRISFENKGKKDIALFIQSKLTSPDKLLWLSLDNRKPPKKCYVIKLNEYQQAFNDVITTMNENIPETEKLRKLLKGVDIKNYCVCIFTNMEKVAPQLQCKEFDEDHPIYFLDTRNRGQYRQFDYEKYAKFNTNFYKQLYVFLGQPNYQDMDNTIAQVLGEDSKKMPYLDKVIKDFMQRDFFCGVLTKHEFEMKLCEVMVNYWLIEDKKCDVIIEKFTKLWNKIFSRKEIINLCHNKIAPLVAYYYQCVIRQEIDEYFDWQEGVTKLTQTTKDCIQQKHNKNVIDLNDILFLLWRKNKIPLAIKSEYSANIFNFLQNFKTLKTRFVIFCSEDLPELKEYRSKESVITYVREITDNETLHKIFDLEVSLEGRRTVALSEISGVSIETAVEGIYKDLTISRVLTWTETRENIQHVIGPPLRAPDDKYITRYFTRKDERPKVQEKLTEEAVLDLVGPGLHIIIGEPGMGKSTVLEAFAHSYFPQNFVIYIKLRDCLHDIENSALRRRIESNPIEYFFNKMTSYTDDKIVKSIMEIHKTSKRLCLFLDGFDEILPLHGRRVSSLMEKILNNTDIPIFCTTRPHAEEKITSRACTRCFNLLPFDDLQIAEYFTQTNINDNIRWRLGTEFLSIPLHLNMISQIYVDHENPYYIRRGEMYKRFIELKHETYNNKMNLTQNVAYLSINKSMKQHRDLAMVEIFGEECITAKESINKILNDICNQNIGIVDVTNSNESFQFVHRTFAEYFVADLLLNKIVLPVSKTKYFKFYKIIWFEEDYIDIKRMMKDLTRNFDLWIEPRRYLFMNSENKNKSSTGAFLGWLQCTTSDPNGCTIVDSLNSDYPIRGRLTEDDAATCTKLLTGIHAEVEEDVESNLSLSLLDTSVGIVAFNLAITTGNESIVQLILDLAPQLPDEQDVNGNTGLHIACAFGHSSIVELLSVRRDNFGIRNNKDRTPLRMATENKQWGIWKMNLIGELSKRSGEDGHASSGKYFSTDISEALLIASSYYIWDIVKLFLEYGADPSISDYNGRTPMHFAAGEADQLEIIKLLWDRGHNVNKKSNDGETPLIIAIKWQNLDIVNWLLGNGADPALADVYGWTPVHFAARKQTFDFLATDNIQTMKVLLDTRPDINVKTNDGQTPLAIARGEEWTDMIELLREHGADGS